MATRRQFVDMNVATLATWLPRFARWLIDDLAGQTGPGWKIVEAYDKTTALQLVPTAGDVSNMDNVAFSQNPFSWQSGTLATGDWIVFQSAHVSNTFHLYIRLASSSTIEMFLLPFGDFVPGVSLASFKPAFTNNATPAVALRKVGENGTTVAVPMAGFATPANYIAVADEECLILVFDNGTSASMAFTYVGQLDGARSFMTPADSRPYVIYDSPAPATLGTSTYFGRFSPLDSSTYIRGLPGGMSYSVSGPPLHTENIYDGLGGAQGVLPLGVCFGVAGHRHFAGFLRYCGTMSESVGPIGTVGGMAYLAVNDATQTSMGIGITWDGVTPYPS